ncbi:indolepyruvate oxidoreductase subunit beta family protein [Pseudonocardia sp. DR1-2]|uniref:indolepyruvate oxidoreductase subunit beta family protein n=1 Tax=Pseudonocardia sp. DR1-2 TaxID=2951168 RepID=UPI002043DEDE|nr:indolepyruvate oxidoreductase subunit beta family protein [Pseudonocardia sp. DR1-2]MCM3848082.1 indolepyruvate oxidoreductase subunit beta family protein [Pseudonocardia sp. DR1-2]
MPTVMPAPAGPSGSWYTGTRPITLAILAMGGEGGGVLADWVVAVAEAAGYHAQTTSVAGVAQRTGATVYYAELHPPVPGTDSADGAGRAEPVLSVFPTPGEVDVVVASELMECGRAVQRGFATPDRTTLITSTNRVYSIDEKMHLGDGRVDSAELVAAAGRAAQHLVAADFAAIAEEHRSVISAALFGALAGSGALPFSRDRFEQAVRDAGKGVEPSLAAFAGGFDAATAALAPAPPAPPAPRAPATVDIAIGPRPVSAEERKEREEARRNDIAATDPESLVGEDLRPLARTVADLPAAARSTVLHGLVRTGVYQDLDYAARYLERVRAFAAVDPDPFGDARLTTEAARHLALWMCYQDTIHVALQKTRARRLERVRDEAGVTSAQLSRVREYLHPQAEEITDTLPYRLGKVLRRSRAFTRAVDRVTREGMVLDTTSVTGYAMLATMARMRPLRPRSLRFVEEQKAIEAWTALALDTVAADADLAVEILVCQKVLKGYGETYAHGNDSFALLSRAAGELRGRTGAAATLARLRSAALADEDGAALRARLSGAGLPTTVPSRKRKH